MNSSRVEVVANWTVFIGKNNGSETEKQLNWLWLIQLSSQLVIV